jgi:hypothetical protein
MKRRRHCDNQRQTADWALKARKIFHICLVDDNVASTASRYQLHPMQFTRDSPAIVLGIKAYRRAEKS